jgi:hypothetical protein
VDYDPALLSPTGCTSFDSLCDTSQPGVAVIRGQASPALNGSSPHTLATLTFALAAPTGTTSTVSATPLLFVDGASVPQAAGTQSLLVVVGRQGDVNLDQSVTAVDALCVLRVVALLPATAACAQGAANEVMADVNADGSVTSVDALCVLREVAQLAPTGACPSLATRDRLSVAGVPAPGRGQASPATEPPRPAQDGAVALSAQTANEGRGKRTAVGILTRGAGMLGAWTLDLTYDSSTVRVVPCYITSDPRIVLLTVFRKTQRREHAEIDRAERAMRTCIEGGHIAEDELI